MAYNNTNMLRIAQIGAMNRPEFRNMPTLDFSGAVDNFFNAKDAAEQRELAEQKRTKMNAYAEVLKQQHPEDAARIEADPLAYAAMLDDNAKAERDQQYKMDYLAKQNANAMGLEQYRNGLRKIAEQEQRAQREAQLQNALASGLITQEQYDIAKRRDLLGDIATGNLPEGVTLTGNKKYDDAYMQEVGKKTAQKVAAEADSEQMKPALIQAMARANEAAKSGTGVGLLGGFAANMGINPLPNAGKNYADIQSANTQMNTFLRKQLAATGLTGSELNSAVEAEAYRYQIKPTDSESIIRRKLQNFAEDKLGGTVFNLNSGAPVQVGQKIGEFTVVGVE